MIKPILGRALTNIQNSELREAKDWFRFDSELFAEKLQCAAVEVCAVGWLVCVLLAAKAGSRRQEASAHIKDRGMYSPPPAAGRLACALANRAQRASCKKSDVGNSRPNPAPDGSLEQTLDTK